MLGSTIIIIDMLNTVPVSPQRLSGVLISGLFSALSSVPGRSRRYDTIWVHRNITTTQLLFPTSQIVLNIWLCACVLTSEWPMLAAAVRACCTAWSLLAAFWLQQEVQLQSAFLNKWPRTSTWPRWAACTNTQRPELST